ncbi:branched-chain amino acid ABC transporter permease [Dactylosporangium sp. NPDC051485]|uniref:branched-chain amino acid ABC transporter permease n=1 Tax=Dactylosporangium sp. NPDC051485 TaxID=3154846 RepID=UPI003438F721
MTTTTVLPTQTDATPRPGSRRGPAAVRHAATGAAGLLAVALPLLLNAYTVSLATNAIILALLALSTQLLAGVAGLPSLGQTAYLAVGAYTAVLLAHAGVTSGPLQLLAATITAAAAAAVTAPLALRSRGPVFMMVTFAIAQLAVITASKWSSVTGGDEGLTVPPITLSTTPAGTAALTNDGYLYWYALAVFAVAAAATGWLLRSRLGLTLRGCAAHEPRMAALGHPVTAELAAGYTAAGGLAGAAGALLTAAHRYVSPADFGFDIAAMALLAAALGAGRMRGAVLGAIAVIATRDLIGTAVADGHGVALLGGLFLAVAYTRPALARLTRRCGRTGKGQDQ